MKEWFQNLNASWQGIIIGLVLVSPLPLFAWLASIQPDRLRQYEVTLGDGTRATCIVVQGVRSAGVTCVPHAFIGHDAEGGE